MRKSKLQKLNDAKKRLNVRIGKELGRLARKAAKAKKKRKH